MPAETLDKPSEGKRIQFEFSADAMRRLNHMKEQADAASYAELVRNSLRVYEWLLKQQEAGYDIGLVKDDALAKTVKFVF